MIYLLTDDIELFKKYTISHNLYYILLYITYIFNAIYRQHYYSVFNFIQKMQIEIIRKIRTGL